MTEIEAQKLLDGVELVPALEGPVLSAKQTVTACLEADIPALLGKETCDDASCSGGCGAGRVQVLVRKDDMDRLMLMLRAEWLEALEREGVKPIAVPSEPPAEGQEPACPACGTAAALVEGACSDCGLQLE